MNKTKSKNVYRKVFVLQQQQQQQQPQQQNDGTNLSLAFGQRMSSSESVNDPLNSLYTIFTFSCRPKGQHNGG